MVTFTCHVFVTVVTYLLGIITLGNSSKCHHYVSSLDCCDISDRPALLGSPVSSALCDTSLILIFFNTAPSSSFIHLWVNCCELDILKSWSQMSQKMPEIKVKGLKKTPKTCFWLTVSGILLRAYWLFTLGLVVTEQKHAVCSRAELFLFWWPGS